MKERNDFGPSEELDVIRLKNGSIEKCPSPVATEVPFTIMMHDKEIATLLCTPCDLRELTYGFLFTSGFIKSTSNIQSFSLDTTRWVATVEADKFPDPSLLEKRLYTSGCGKGVMYASIQEVSYRKPIQNKTTISNTQIASLAQWLQHCSDLYKGTGGVHTAALSIRGEIPLFHIDDIGRHNAVDKIIGRALIQSIDFAQTIFFCSGRTSSEILHKARTCGIPIIISRGAPTHQAILRARDMGITLVGFARGSNFTIYSHEERIIFK